MQSRWIIRASVLAALVLAIVLVQTAGAGKFHFNSVNLGIGSLVLTGQLAGLGNEAGEVTLTGFGTVKALCENKGGQQAPGRNPIKMNVQQTEVFVLNENGQTQVKVTAQDPSLSEIKPSPTPKQAGCPNGNWKVTGIIDGSTDWTAAKVVVKDESGKVQIDLSFKCTTIFENGVGTDIQCVET
jgi:hypothetical protein